MRSPYVCTSGDQSLTAAKGLRPYDFNTATIAGKDLQTFGSRLLLQNVGAKTYPVAEERVDNRDHTLNIVVCKNSYQN